MDLGDAEKRPRCGIHTKAGLWTSHSGTYLSGSVPIRHSFHLIGFARSVTAKQTLGKAVPLLLVEARVQRLGCVGELLSVVGALDLTIGVLSDFVEHIDRAMLLGA